MTWFKHFIGSRKVCSTHPAPAESCPALWQNNNANLKQLTTKRRREEKRGLNAFRTANLWILLQAKPAEDWTWITSNIHPTCVLPYFSSRCLYPSYRHSFSLFPIALILQIHRPYLPKEYILPQTHSFPSSYSLVPSHIPFTQPTTDLFVSASKRS